MDGTKRCDTLNIEMTRKVPIKRTKIIATLGPASDHDAVITKMIQSGVDIFRLNASHQSNPEYISGVVTRIRRLAKNAQKSVGIFLYLQGPKIRTGEFKVKKAILKNGQPFIITTRKQMGDATGCSVSYAGLVKDVNVGELVYIDDGKIRLKVVDKKPFQLICKVIEGGQVSNHKGINLPASNIKISALTEKDRADARTAVENQLDYLAISFVRDAQDIRALRKYLITHCGKTIPIIAKMELQLALDNMRAIVDEADAVMVARGDLGVEIGVENVPFAQKRIIHESNRRIKPVIVATQMLETMTHQHTATRAEVSDVANAIYDRCDAVMLSGETAVGIDPPGAVGVMRTICEATDSHMITIKKQDISSSKFIFSKSVKSTTTTLVKAADQIAQENEASALLVFTKSGQSALIASKLNPMIPIIAATDNDTALRRMALFKGVVPVMLPQEFDTIHRWRDMIDLALERAKHRKYLKRGDRVVITAGIPLSEAGGTNSIRIQTVE